MMGKFYVAHVDLSAADLHTIFLTSLKAKQFKEYWGIDEVEEHFYKFDIPKKERIVSIPSRVYFQTFAGVSEEIVIFYHEDIDKRIKIISPTVLKQYFDIECLMGKIKQFYVQGYIENNKIVSLSEPYGYIPTLLDEDVLNETIAFQGREYENTYPYEYTLASLEEDLKLERECSREDRKKESSIRAIEYGLGVPRYELESLYRDYEKYLVLAKQGKANGFPNKMTFRRYFLWRERGGELYERSHRGIGTVKKLDSDGNTNKEYSVGTELRKKCTYLYT